MFPLRAVGTDAISGQKPAGFTFQSVCHNHLLSNLLDIIHPPAQFFSPVLENDSNLIFIAVIGRHGYAP